MQAPSAQRIERITGPFNGFYVAAYAVECAGGFVGYAKICMGEPRDVWDCCAIDKVATPASTSRESAVLFAEQRARDLVRALTRGTGGGGNDSQEHRHNLWMRARTLLPTSPAAWFKGSCAALLLLVGLAMLNGMACSVYARQGTAAPQTEDPLYQPAALIDGSLCTAGGACTSAVLVQGVLSTHTLAQLRERANKSMPGALTVCFNSPGGTYEAATIAGELPPNLRTCVADLVSKPGAQPQHALCASACAWTWMAGARRVIYAGNSVGFHAPYEYDAPICVPGNRVKGLLSVAAGWWADRAHQQLGETERATRNGLRVASLKMGPRDVLPVGPDQAVTLGLQAAAEPAATFFAAARPQAVTAR